MATINDLSFNETPALSDQIPSYSAASGTTQRTSINNLLGAAASLPTVQPVDGSNELWIDPLDGNAIKVAIGASSSGAGPIQTIYQLENGTAPDAGTLTGAEIVPMNRTDGLLQTTLNNIATFVLSIFTILFVSGAGAVARTISAWALDRPFSVKDFGAKLDGTTDDTVAFQNAINFAQTFGKQSEVLVPAGTLRLTAPLTVSSSLTISGAGHAGQGTVWPAPSLNNGTLIKFDHAGFGFTVTGSGFTFKNAAVFRPQVAPGTGWAPYASNYDFNLSSTDTTLDNVLFWGTAKGIILNVGGRLEIRNIKGQFFNAGLTVVSATDCVRVLSCHMWPFWSQDANVKSYTLANLVATEWRRCDGAFLNNFFCIWAKTNIYFNHDTTGDTSNFKGSNLYLDECSTGILTSSTTSGVTAKFSNVNHLSDPAGGAGIGIQLNGNNAVISFADFQSLGANLNAVRNSDGTSNRLSIGALYITQWNQNNSGFGGVDSSGTGNVITIGPNAIIGAAAAGGASAFSGGNPRQGQYVKGGFTLTTDASGQIAIPHGAAFAPGDADVSTLGAFPYNIHVQSIDAAHVNAIIFNGTAALANTSVTGAFKLYY